MTDHDPYSVDAARAAGERGELARWVADFLASEGSDNPELARQLSDRLPWWIGPVLVPMRSLHRLAGPPDQPVVCVVDEDEWRDDVDDLGDKVREGWQPPPVIASYREGQLVVEDGNHRIEGERRAGEQQVWTIIGFDDPDARDRFVVPEGADRA
jgi:hypothetical protein